MSDIDPNIIELETSCVSPWEEDALPMADALEQIYAELIPLADSVRLPVRDCLGQVLAESLHATLDVPSHTNSAMDGYALAASDLPQDDTRTLRIVGEAFAGQAANLSCGSGECVRIMTGAIMPAGTDTVVMQEQSRRIDDDYVEIGAGHRAGQNVRQAGEDISQGEKVFDIGRRLTPADIGVLASFGQSKITVKRRVRVAFFSTGDELRQLGQPLAPGTIYDSNRYTLHSMLKQLDAEIIDLGSIPDDPLALSTALQEASAAADIVITSGGVSVGEADYIQRVLDESGKTFFSKIAVKPGRPLTFAQLADSWFFGLPGNPVAVMITFLQFVEPAIRYLAGEGRTQRLRIPAACQDNIRKRPGRTEFQRGILSFNELGDAEVRRTGQQGSGILTSMSLANCFIVLDDAQGDVAVGDRVFAEPLWR